MAKYGEGDKRWIVEDRAGGANVHNWHWAETDCLPWSRNLLTKLLSDHTLLSGEGNLFVKTNKVDKVQGEEDQSVTNFYHRLLSNARISKEVGGEFSIFDGSIMGTNVELQEGKLIVQKWRFGSWPDGIQSTVRLAFEEPEPGVTIVKLTQTDVPEEDRYGNSTAVENTERGWRDLIFHKIRAVFGFGI